MRSNQLVFLISQPRSGSSLTQQLMLNSNLIVSTPEPWQMLSLIYTYKSSSIDSGYNPSFSSSNFSNFLNTIDNGLIDFKQSIKQLALDIYGKKIGNSKYFLDKTPRYYHIIDDLYEMFPDAKFIFLVRNPLSVFSSILDYNYNGNFRAFLNSDDRKNDLFLAPGVIMKTLDVNKNAILIKYEELVENSEVELHKIFKYLDLEYPEQLDSYSISGVFNDSKSMDTKSIKKHSKPTSEYIDAWKKTINSTQKKKTALEYIKKLQILYPDYFGYDLKKIESAIINHKPLKKSILKLNFDILTKSEEQLGVFTILKKRLIIKLESL